VITDFDQRAALQVYKHVPSSGNVLPEAFDALHRLGIGTDSLNVEVAARSGALRKYALVVIPAATALDHPDLPGALQAYVEAGGHVVLTPFTAYQSWDGVFRNDGFGANLAALTGVLVRTARRMGTAEGGDRKDQHVAWLGGLSPVGIDGYCEYLDIQPEAEVEVIGRFQSDEPTLHDRPAITRRKVGNGSVIKLAFWPKDDSVVNLFRGLLPAGEMLLAEPAPRGVQAVPRADQSLFVINTAPRPAAIRLVRAAKDRISGRLVAERHQLKAYEVLWLEQP
jgi:beta-galactosidase GanA